MSDSTTGKLNCWQFKNCGREPGGVLTELVGECPVARTMKYDGLNDGIGAGRACWMVRNAACKEAQNMSAPVDPCHTCDFYKRVVFEQDEETCFRYTSIPV
ncbi:MAG: hypothetical protein OEV49_10670 [candidate division Zixibacteria bacterium]|nr:hypothetical protein [candidate division Zixibacteria bacterium]MDH3938822.1 hypothetical protein [candidate division Zixibacteria bacterium]MDH4035690.1 hypothetical protein [candidate division Zixibacteria bacterium]